MFSAEKSLILSKRNFSNGMRGDSNEMIRIKFSNNYLKTILRNRMMRSSRIDFCRDFRYSLIREASDACVLELLTAPLHCDQADRRVSCAIAAASVVTVAACHTNTHTHIHVYHRK